MKNPILHFPSLRLLSMCICALLCLSSVGYASPQPSNDVHFCLPLNLEDMRARDSIYAATKHALNLNVGAPRTVRMIYFLPNDRPFRQEVVDSMKVTIRQIQTFYAEQMEARGHGRKTFRFETDARGEPLVHRVDGQHPDSHYLDDTTRTVLDEIEQAFDRDVNIYLIVIDNSINAIGTGNGRRAGGTGGNRGKSGGHGLVPGGFSFHIAAHELGHAFGLRHDFNDDTYIMSYGGDQRSSLSACHAEFLAVHLYFNADIPLEKGLAPTRELLSPRAYPAGTSSVPIRVRVSDSDGLHQVLLFAKTREPHSAAGFLEVKACRGFVGEREAIVEFDYDGVIPSDGSTNLSDSAVHLIHIRAVDIDGNVGYMDFSLTEIPPHRIATFVHSKEGLIPEVRAVAFSRDGTTLASASSDGTVKLWDMATRTNIRTLEHSSWVEAVAFSPDGKILASHSQDVNLWDVSTGQNIVTLFRSYGGGAVAFSRDGTILASGSADNKVRLWDVSARREITTFVHGQIGPSLHTVAFSPVEPILASGSQDGTIKLWDITAQHHIATLESHSGSVFSVAFSPDGTTLASSGITRDSTGDRDSTVKLWDVATRQLIITLEEHSGWVRSVVFSPDGTLLASGSFDNTVKLWDVATWRNVATLGTPNNTTAGGCIGRIHSVDFSPDEAILASGVIVGNCGGPVGSVIPASGEVQIWDVSALGLGGASQASFSLSLDGDGAAGDQAVTSLDVSPGSVVSIEVFGKDIQGAEGFSIRFEYDAEQVLYEGFDSGGVLPNAQVLSMPGTNPTAIEIWIASFGGRAAADSGLVGRIRFRTTSTFSGTTLRLMRAELGRGEERERITFDDTSVTLQLAALTPDFNGDGRVDLDDFLLFVEHLGFSRGDEGYDAKYDLDEDGVIGFGDFLIFANAFGKEG